MARAGRIKAETAANTLQVDGAVRTFITQLDQAIISGKKTELESRIVPGELVRFISGVVGTQPEIWQTRVLRTEQLDANLVAADVSLDTKELESNVPEPQCLCSRAWGATGNFWGSIFLK